MSKSLHLHDIFPTVQHHRYIANFHLYKTIVPIGRESMLCDNFAISTKCITAWKTLTDQLRNHSSTVIYFHLFSSPRYLLTCAKIRVFCLFLSPIYQIQQEKWTRHCKATESDIKVEELHPYHPHLSVEGLEWLVGKWIYAKFTILAEGICKRHLLKQLCILHHPTSIQRNFRAQRLFPVHLLLYPNQYHLGSTWTQL